MMSSLEVWLEIVMIDDRKKRVFRRAAHSSRYVLSVQVPVALELL